MAGPTTSSILGTLDVMTRLWDLARDIVAWRPGLVFVLIIGGWLVTRITRVLVRRIVRRIALRSARLARRTSMWRTRGRRPGVETLEQGEYRRRQRIDAAASMIHHMLAVMIWISVAIAVFHLLELDAAFFLSSAGFIGAGLAIGGAQKVNDYLTGLSVLLEDRYGVGDEIVAHVPNWDAPVRGIVEAIGLVSTRLRDDSGTLHLPHGSLNGLRNLSQEPAEARLAVSVPADVDPDIASQVVADLMRDLAGSKHLTEVLFVDDIKATPAEDGMMEVEVRTSRPLDAEERSTLVRNAEQRLTERI